MASPAPSPKGILRGHKAQIHAATFIRDNARLVTCDAEGYVVLWDLTIMRAKAVWRAHENSILGVKGWGCDRIITHGRDNKLVVWKLGLEDEEGLSTALPVENVAVPRPQPWVLHILEVNTMNFCSFASCTQEVRRDSTTLGDVEGVLMAVPNTLASESIDIFALPSQSRIHTIKPGQGNGMAMALALFHKDITLTLIAAFENGYASVHRLESDGQWTMTYRSQAHSQPILSLDVHPDCEFFLTSAADAVIAKHPIPIARQEVSESPSNKTVHTQSPPASQNQPSLLSAAFNSSRTTAPPPKIPKTKEWEHPLKTTNTKHSGQQNLKIRSDGKIFATAGWDSNLRVYSVKTLKELAVLQWHKVGSYAIAFSDVDGASGDRGGTGTIQGPGASQKLSEGGTQAMAPLAGASKNVVAGGRLTVKDRRVQEARATHWIVGGAKDGKVSLWDIY